MRTQIILLLQVLAGRACDELSRAFQPRPYIRKWYAYIISTGAKEFPQILLGPLQAKGKTDFFDGH